MAIQSLESFDAENEKKRARLERDLELVSQLPTAGMTYTWTGEGGFEKDGNTRKPPIEKTVELVPWIVHSPFRGCEHVAFRVPESYKGVGEYRGGEYFSAMRAGYIRAVCEAFAPYVVRVLGLKGRYASFVPETWEWSEHRDYEDAQVVADGGAVLTASTGVGEHPHSSVGIEFYVSIEMNGEPTTVKVTMDLPGGHKVTPRPEAVKHHGKYGPVSSVERWRLPEIDGVVHSFKRGSGDHLRRDCRAEYLFNSVEDALDAVGV